jgi:plastocyanin
MMRRALPLLAVAVFAGMATTAAAATAPPVTARANAEGNIVTGGLRFFPADLTVHVGEAAAWTNTDFLVPHTVTETHGLWDLSGTYGGTGLTPPGFGPGTIVQRGFEAGTHRFLCVVHGPVMSGSVAVPVDVSSVRTTILVKQKPIRTKHGLRKRKPKKVKIATVTMRWAAAAEPTGLAFDVQRRRPGGAWEQVAAATTTTDGSFRTSPGVAWEVRARLRRASDAAAGTDWSPAAAVTA